MPSYSFDPRLRGTGYRNLDTGRFASRKDVLDWVNGSLSQSKNVTDTLAAYVGGESPILSVADWKKAMRQEIKDEYIRQYLGGIGGRDQMTQARWGQVGGMLSEQYKHLDGFADDLENLSEAQIRARSRMYVHSSKEGFERAQKQVKIGAGAEEERWNLTDAENCQDCIDFAARGWVLIEDDVFDGCEPGSGCTECLTNCMCFKTYR
jgi:hypothetical protein